MVIHSTNETNKNKLFKTWYINLENENKLFKTWL